MYSVIKIKQKIQNLSSTVNINENKYKIIYDLFYILISFIYVNMSTV